MLPHYYGEPDMKTTRDNTKETTVRYITEPGFARGFWVLDTQDESKRNYTRYMKWFAVAEDATAHAILLNTPIKGDN